MLAALTVDHQQERVRVANQPLVLPRACAYAAVCIDAKNGYLRPARAGVRCSLEGDGAFVITHHSVKSPKSCITT